MLTGVEIIFHKKNEIEKKSSFDENFTAGSYI